MFDGLDFLSVILSMAMLFAFHYVCGFFFLQLFRFELGLFIYLFRSCSFVCVWFFQFVVSGLLEWRGSKIVLQRIEKE